MVQQEMPSNNEGEPTPKSRFVEMLEARWSKGNFVCVGLDSDFSQIPQAVKAAIAVSAPKGAYLIKDVMFEFNKQIIDATSDLVSAYKPNIAFYEAQGQQGLGALFGTIKHIKDNYPDIPVILDAKRADIGNTNNGYIQAAFDELGADAITVNPYFGKEAMQPFLDRKDKGIIVLVRTSNPGAKELQALPVKDQAFNMSHGFSPFREMPLYERVAYQVAEDWNENGNCAVVVGATAPVELSRVRAIVGDMPILLPGIGAQGGEVEATVAAGKDSRNMGMIINSSRGILFASKGPDFAEAARAATEKLTLQINEVRSK